MITSNLSLTGQFRTPETAIQAAVHDMSEVTSPAPSIWTLTLGLVAFFLVCSFVTASLATYFGWLNPAAL